MTTEDERSPDYRRGQRAVRSLLEERITLWAAMVRTAQDRLESDGGIQYYLGMLSDAQVALRAVKADHHHELPSDFEAGVEEVRRRLEEMHALAESRWHSDLPSSAENTRLAGMGRAAEVALVAIATWWQEETARSAADLDAWRAHLQPIYRAIYDRGVADERPEEKT